MVVVVIMVIVVVMVVKVVVVFTVAVSFFGDGPCLNWASATSSAIMQRQCTKGLKNGLVTRVLNYKIAQCQVT